MITYLLALITGTIAASSAVLMIKASTIPPGYLGSLRLIFASIIFLVPAILQFRKTYRNAPELTPPSLKEILSIASPPGVLLGLHFITWNIAARLTLAANASLIVNMIPLIMPVLAFLLYKHSLHRRETLGSLIALGGIGFLSYGSVQLDPEYIAGDAMALFSMFFFASYLILAKRGRNLPLLTYLVAVYVTGSITSFLGGLVIDGPFRLEYLMVPELYFVLGLALIPTMLGHSFINLAMRHLPSQVVSIAQLTQFMWASFFAWVLFNEIPSWTFYPAATMVVAGGFLSISAHWSGWQSAKLEKKPA